MERMYRSPSIARPVILVSVCCARAAVATPNEASSAAPICTAAPNFRLVVLTFSSSDAGNCREMRGRMGATAPMQLAARIVLLEGGPVARWHVSADVLSQRIGSAQPDALREEYKRPVMGQPVLAAKPLTSRETVSHYAASNGQTIRTSRQKSIRAFHFGGTVSHIYETGAAGAP